MYGNGGSMNSPKIGDTLWLEGRRYVIVKTVSEGYVVERAGMNWWKRLLVRACCWLMDKTNTR